MSRTELLRQLIEMSVPLPQVISRLSDQSWDAGDDLVELGPEHCKNVLTRFARGELARTDVEAWANAIECREDVGIQNAVVREVLHELANPIITFPLSPGRAEALLLRLPKRG